MDKCVEFTTTYNEMQKKIFTHIHTHTNICRESERKLHGLVVLLQNIKKDMLAGKEEFFGVQ